MRVLGGVGDNKIIIFFVICGWSFLVAFFLRLKKGSISLNYTFGINRSLS